MPLFFPLPANPPPSSTPAHKPGLPSISPTYFNKPSKPRDSIRTLSPISKDLLTLLANTSECRLGGRLGGLADVGVFARSVVLVEAPIAEDAEAAEFGRPTERWPD